MMNGEAPGMITFRNDVCRDSGDEAATPRVTMAGFMTFQRCRLLHQQRKSERRVGSTQCASNGREQAQQ
jgi:hypothetical protein